jgi:hypothetical protein
MKFQFIKYISVYFVSFVLAKNTFAANLKDAFTNAKTVAENGHYTTRAGLLNSAAGNVITAFLSLLGVIFIILSVYGGFLYLTAQGNQEQTKKALTIITQSIIGLIIIMAAYAISYFIFKFFI